MERRLSKLCPSSAEQGMSHSDRCGVCRRRGGRMVVAHTEFTDTEKAAGTRFGDLVCVFCGSRVHPPEQKRKQQQEDE